MARLDIHRPTCDRRRFLAVGAAACATGAFSREALDRRGAFAATNAARPAQIAITLDLEMSAQYPRRGQTEWNFEKGNLDETTKRYAVEAARRVHRRGGVIHFFCVGRVLEQPDIQWLQEIADLRHPIGNHTYDHVNVKAKSVADAQFRFQRAPWLADGLSAADLIRQNIRITTEALRSRADIRVSGFRTPGGFHDGLNDRQDIQELLKELGFTWVSSKYPAHPTGKVGESPTDEILDGIVKAQAAAQPYVYPNGLIELPMSPISDVTAFRSQRWKLDDFLRATRLAVEECIARGTVYDFLAHPSCLAIEDPEFRAIDLICDLVDKSRGQAAITSLDKISASVKS